MNSKTLTLMLTLALAAGCNDKKAPAAAIGGEAGTTSVTLARAPEQPAAPAEVGVDDFVAKVAPATCRVVEQCKNDKVKALLVTTTTVVAAFGAMEKPALQKELAPAQKGMTASKRWLPTETECTTIGSVALKVVGLQPAFVKANNGKTLAYDAKKAAACLAALNTAPEPCSAPVTLAAAPKLGELEALTKDVKAPVEAYVAPCDGVLTGLVEANGACEYDMECKGKKSKCRPGKKPKTRTCQQN